MWKERYITTGNDLYQKNNRHIPIKEVFAGKRMRFFIGIVLLLWIAVGSQYLANKLFAKEGNIMEAFVTTNTGLMESTLEMTAEYSNKYLTVKDKRDLIQYIASSLGITIDSELLTYEGDRRQELSFEKQAQQAQTTIKIVTIGDKDTTDAFAQASERGTGITQYLMVRIMIYEDANNDILYYRDVIDSIYKNLDIDAKKVNTTLQLCGAYAGDLLLTTKNKLADDMIRSLEGKVVYENRDDSLYTIYAYTGLLREYIMVDQSKINIQVAISYDEVNDCTRIYLATPIISGEW